MTALTAPLRGLRRPDAVTLAVLAVVAAALVLRLVDLGARAMHHDESLHATFAWYLADGRGYRHDPLMHGPLQFHVIAALFKLIGDSEWVTRLFPALAGTALVAAPLLLRRWLGGTATVVAALLLALSPTLLYFSRFARNDVPAALWTLLLVTAVWRYRREGRGRWLGLLAGALALAFVTKETSYLAVAMLLLYLHVALARTLFGRLAPTYSTRAGRRVLAVVGLALGAWLLAALWRPLGRRLVAGPRPREADLLVLLGTLTLPLLAAALRFPVAALGGEGEIGHTAAVVAVLVLLAASAAVGLGWDWRRWAPLALLFYAILLPLYSTGFTNVDGLGSAFWGTLDYWLDQQGVQRGEQPWFYYLMMLPLYELLALLPALAGGLWLLWRGNALTRLLVWWLAATLIALSFAGEKMPWLTVHLALPLALLAAQAAGAAAPALVRALRRLLRPPALAAAGVVTVALALLALSLRTAAGVAFAHPDTPREPLIYTQTSPDVPPLLREIERYADAGAGRDGLVITVDTTASFAWPWAWYLRHFPRAGYLSAQALADSPPTEGVLIVARSTLDAQPELRERFTLERPYRHRWWFPEDYKGTSFGDLWSGLRDGSLIADWLQFYAARLDEGRLGSIDGVVLFPAAGR